MFQRYVGSWAVAMAAFASLVIFSAGCASAVQTGSGIPGGTTSGPVGKATVALVPQSSGNWDPALNAGAADTPNTEVLYNRLTETPSDSLKIVPGLATKWAMSTDGKAWEFELRKGVKFHNGDEVTPEDVVYSVDRTKRIGSPSAIAFLERYLDSIAVKGDSVVFRLKVPLWSFVSSISGQTYSVVPKKYTEKVGDDGFVKAPVGTGPFKFVEGSKQEYLEVEAVDYEHFRTKPGVKRLRYAIVGEETTRLAMVRTGEADLAQVSVSSLKAMQGSNPLKAIKASSPGGLRLFTWGQEDPKNPFSKLEVRQALSLAIDRKAIADGVFQGYARAVATGYWNPAQPGWPEWGFDAPKQDMEKAKDLLAKAGYPEGKGLTKITFHTTEYGATPGWTQAAPVIAEYWKRLGLQVELRQWEWDAFYAQQRAGKFDPLAITVSTANGGGESGAIGLDLSKIGTYLYAAGVAQGAHPEAEKMVRQFQEELDEGTRAELVQKILIYARDNLTSIPVVTIDGLWAGGPRLTNYTPRPGTYSTGNMYTITVQP